MKILENGFAQIRGLFTCIFSSLFSKNVSVDANIRVFGGARIRIERGAKCTIGKNFKAMRFADISVHSNATFAAGSDVSVGSGCKIVCQDSISIGKGTLLAPNVLIYDHNHKFYRDCGVRRKEFSTSGIEIGENCWIGANTVILKGTKIGNNCVVGAGSVISGVFADNQLIVQKRDTQSFEINTVLEKQHV